jgi:hypothetical protein
VDSRQTSELLIKIESRNVTAVAAAVNGGLERWGKGKRQENAGQEDDQSDACFALFSCPPFSCCD